MSASRKPSAPSTKKSPAKQRRAVGRPSLYTDGLADRICEMLAEGTGMHIICAMPGFPHPVTVYRWLDANEEFRNKYTRARERAADRFASDVIAIADQADETIRSVEKARLRIDARKWAAGKFAPKKYAERVNTELSGTVTHRDGGPDLSALSEDELENAIALASKIAAESGGAQS